MKYLHIIFTFILFSSIGSQALAVDNNIYLDIEKEGPIKDSLETTDSVKVKSTIYPNPSNGIFIIDLSNLGDSETEIEYSIGDVLGKKKKSEKAKLASGESVKIKKDLTTFAPGIYFIWIKAGNNYIVERIVIGKP